MMRVSSVVPVPICRYSSECNPIMTNPILPLLAIGLYWGVGALLWRGQRRGGTHGPARVGIYALALGAIVLHGALLYNGLIQPQGLNLGFTQAISLVAWAVAALFLAAALGRPIESLGMIIMPIAGLMLALEWLWPGQHWIATSITPLESAHIVVSLLAYSLLSIAVLQSLMLMLQERYLRAHQAGGFLRALPPIETMESLMFQMIAVGFGLLTLIVVSGIFFSEAVFGKPLRFTHHVVLSLIAWAVFAVLLIGHWRFGWRGRTALRWTLVGFSLLALAYFGSKFVLEILLDR